MGIIANTKQFIARKAVAAAQKAGDGIAKASSLSPEQLQTVDKKRESYLSEMPNMNGKQAQTLIERSMGTIGVEVYQAYLEQLGNIYAPINTAYDGFDEENRIRFFNITKWVTDSEEKSLDKLVNVYHVLSREDCNIALIYHREKLSCTVSIGIVNTNDRYSDPAIADKLYSRIVGALKGNFPGSDIDGMYDYNNTYGVGVPDCLRCLTDEKHTKSVAVVSNVATEKSENFVSQSMEKLLDGIVPENDSENYTIVLLAKPVQNQLESQNRLYELCTALAPYASWQTGYTYTESDGVSSSAAVGVNLGASAGAHATSNLSRAYSISNAVNKSKSNSVGGFTSVTTGTSTSASGGVNVAVASANATVGSHIDGTIGGDYHHTSTNGTTNTRGFTDTEGTGTGANASANFGVSFSRTSSVTAQVGKNESLTQSFTNYGVKHTLEIIEEQLKRIEESSALGMWEFASYFISESPVIANNTAHMYLALTQGEQSYMTNSSVNFWDGEVETDAASTILQSIRKLQHPVFGLKMALEDEWLMYPTLVTPTTMLSGKELARALNFPRKSVSGLPVLEVVSFGREPHTLQNSFLNLELGYGYHMRKKISGQRINISKQELTKHTFITGSTGSGKSNTIYTLLDRLSKDGVKFMVIEPAKGEYKDVIGKRNDVVTYGTNPCFVTNPLNSNSHIDKLKSAVGKKKNDISDSEELRHGNVRILRINPFRFPKHTHVLEHLDRLVEIFNVCWPMYAAMPAILKDAIERAYEASGWDLIKSANRYDDNLFPTFNDVVKEIRKILDESDYSADNKGDYTGSLVTRLHSLTNGINRLIFTNDDIGDEALFDSNVIIDLSRIGSTETKSLIMGILVLKLQEHRMEQRAVGANANDELKHITVLEEAHNLLRRTSVEQTSEGANLKGKSVEMLANSIAEMRTYGEGFVIADQSPGLLDMSVIRNTNTKLILRLPDLSDRELVGRAAGLSDNQVTELARLEQGVAAVSQSDWLEPVLCKVDKYSDNNWKSYGRKTVKDEKNIVDSDAVAQSLLDCIMTKEIYRKGDRVDIAKLKEAVLKSGLETSVKCDLIDYIKTDRETAVDSLRKLVYDFLKAEEAVNVSVQCDDITKWVHSVADNLSMTIRYYSKKQIDLVMALIVYEQSLRDSSYDDLCNRFTELLKTTGGVY